MTKAVLFDLGQVLVHYDHAQTIAGLAAVCGDGSTQPAALARINTWLSSNSHALSTGRMETEAMHSLMRTQAGATESPEAFFNGFCAGLKRNEAALAYALELEATPNVLVAVISNTNAAHVRWLDAYVPELRSFDLVMMSNEISIYKPDPAVFRLALELLDVEAHNALFVDDAATNVAAAQALGMQGIVHSDWAITRPRIDAWLEKA